MLYYWPCRVGETILSETMLYESGSKNSRGWVEDKPTTSAYRDIEHEKGDSVFGTLLNLDRRGNKINLIDTPGTSDYIGEVVGALRVADTAFLLNADYGNVFGRFYSQNRGPGASGRSGSLCPTSKIHYSRDTGFRRTFFHYAEVPRDVQKKIVEQKKTAGSTLTNSCHSKFRM